MSDQLVFVNPFERLGELLSDLRRSLIAEFLPLDAGAGLPPNAYTGQLLGTLAGFITQCEHLRVIVATLERHDGAAFEAFQRALAKQ